MSQYRNTDPKVVSTATISCAWANGTTKDCCFCVILSSRVPRLPHKSRKSEERLTCTYIVIMIHESWLKISTTHYTTDKVNIHLPWIYCILLFSYRFTTFQLTLRAWVISRTHSEHISAYWYVNGTYDSVPMRSTSTTVEPLRKDLHILFSILHIP